MAIKICLDAGHYGKYNRSPIVKEYYESDMNWRLHLKLREQLEARGFEVITTRPNQEGDLALYDRGAAAKGCSLFMSLHSNAAYSTKEYNNNGGSHPNEYVDRVDIYVTLDGKADDLGKKLADKIAEVMETDQGGSIKTREHKGGEYYGVLRGAAAVGVPGMLVEHSFHTNARSARWLLDEANLDKLARAEADVIAAHYGQHHGTLIEGRARATVYQMEEYIKKVNPDVPQSVIDMLPLYLSEGAVEGIRGDIAFAQSCLETGNFGFEGSAVTLEMNNFCGMGVTLGRPGNSFETPQMGIRAQIQHLKAYANEKELLNPVVDPRFEKVLRGCAPYVEWLGIQENPQGKGWASGEGYGEKILNILDRVLTVGVKKKLGDRTLRRGDEGEDVRELQELLMMAGYDLGAYGADGDFGGKTEAAVKEFQGWAGLTADGVYGAKTHKALLAEKLDPEEPPVDPEEPPVDPEDEATHVLLIFGKKAELEVIQAEHGGDMARML